MLAQRPSDKYHAGVNEEIEGINCNNPFHFTGLFLYPLKVTVLQCFQGGIEEDQ